MATPQELALTALDASTADDCIAIVSTHSTANLRWANNTLTTNGLANTCNVTVVSVVDLAGGRAAGVRTRTASSLDDVRALTVEADATARASTPSDDAAPLVSGGASSSFDAEPGATSIDAFSGFASALGTSFRSAAAEARVLYGYVEHDVTTTYIATSTGLRLRHEQPTGQIGMTGKAADLSSSAWVGQAVEQVDQLDVGALTDEIARRLSWASTKVELPAGRYPTLLPPTAVSDLMIYLLYVSSGRDAHEGQTVWSDLEAGTKVGQRVAKPGVRLYADPQEPGVNAKPFDVATATNSFQSVFDNGLGLSATDLISDGILRSLITSRHTAAMTGLPVAPPIDNLILNVGGDGDVDDLVSTVERGLLVTCLWYIREVDPQSLLLTGLTRDGVYLIEDGKVSGAVNNFRFNESPVDLLSRFSAAGATQRSYSREWGDYFPRTAMPPLLIPDFNMSTVSQAS
ncbi:MAG TPA: metallopeptidase TldD-related protein [Nocardioidaceae bacterium]|nr:metallopeptidase TldD-related protein [Nocardioidaceae bacterium]